MKIQNYSFSYRNVEYLKYVIERSKSVLALLGALQILAESIHYGGSGAQTNILLRIARNKISYHRGQGARNVLQRLIFRGARRFAPGSLLPHRETQNEKVSTDRYCTPCFLILDSMFFSGVQKT